MAGKKDNEEKKGAGEETEKDSKNGTVEDSTTPSGEHKQGRKWKEAELEEHLHKIDDALNTVNEQLTDITGTLTTIQAEELAEAEADKQREAAWQARFQQQQEAASDLAKQIEIFRAQEAKTEKRQEEEWAARFKEEKAALTNLGKQLTSLKIDLDKFKEEENAEDRKEAEEDARREEEWEKRFGHQQEAMGAIYSQLVEVRKGVEAMQEAAEDANLRGKLELVPVRTGDMMRGFQAAVSRANMAERTGETEGEEIGHMSIKDLEVQLQAPLIEGGHAEDPIVMLPNIKSVDRRTASISLKFNVVSLPAKQRG